MAVWPHPPERVSILGVPVDVLARNAVDAWLGTAMAAQDAGACRHLVTLNPEYVMLARRDAAFRKAIQAADLVTPDGIGVALAMRWLRPAYPPFGQISRADRVTGVDVTEMIAAHSAARAVPVFLLGAAPGVAGEAATRLGDRYRGFVLAGAWGDGSPGADDDAATLGRIRTSGAVVVLVAYGAPGQVEWIARNREALATAGVRLAVGVGGAFDFLSGRVRRAPAWMRRLGLEWLYRLLREPWRWRRQLVLPVFAWRVVWEGARQRREWGDRQRRGV